MATSPWANIGTIQEGLERYKHITLTDDEKDAAILAAKMRKHDIIKEERVRVVEAENRKNLIGPWLYGATKTYMLNRAEVIFKKQFKVDSFNRETFERLCLYFSNDPNFVTAAASQDNPNPSLEKGILLSSPFGHGKTWLMELFSKNARQVYKIISAKKIANDYENHKEAGIEEYMEPYKNPFQDKASFYQVYSGLCIDDFGAEELKNSYGNKRNVLADIVEHRYATNKIDPAQPELRKTGPMLHITTNLDANGIHAKFGGRVASRIKEMFNILDLPGNDRRK